MFQCDTNNKNGKKILLYIFKTISLISKVFPPRIVIIKGVAKKNWCFKFYNFGLRFLKENVRYPFSLRERERFDI
jgi:hypothetical protein